MMSNSYTRVIAVPSSSLSLLSLLSLLNTILFLFLFLRFLSRKARDIFIDFIFLMEFFAYICLQVQQSDMTERLLLIADRGLGASLTFRPNFRSLRRHRFFR